MSHSSVISGINLPAFVVRIGRGETQRKIIIYGYFITIVFVIFDNEYGFDVTN